MLGDVAPRSAELSELVGDLVELAREDPPTAGAASRSTWPTSSRGPSSGSRGAHRTCEFDTEPTRVVLFGDAARAGAGRAPTCSTTPPSGARRAREPSSTSAVAADAACCRSATRAPASTAADLPHVFDRFYRSRKAAPCPAPASGLAIVRQAVERHGGTVAAGSRRRAGTARAAAPCLTVRLPASSEPLGRSQGLLSA